LRSLGNWSILGCQNDTRQEIAGCGVDGLQRKSGI
jgi:hypothetical protein